ncbi:E3 ubiquitin-protein ligase ATL6 [Senna tora]|uniref:RING-type E3 ubiquitin transferase n=1 Tax=Senna tora TaxID=362788 RepID=A0A834WCU6_9FABA|nr:E3 ubiquitin-protein ligase ATL6 [Senna tora]
MDECGPYTWYVDDELHPTCHSTRRHGGMKNNGYFQNRHPKAQAMINQNSSPSLLCFLLPLLLSPSLVAPQSPNGQSDQVTYNSFTPSMAIIIVILIAALFLMGFFSIYIRHCADSPSGSVRPLGLGAARSRRAARGLDPSLINTFPTLQYSEVKVHKIGKGALECAVCLCEFEDSETLRLIPKCDHVFHPDCIDEWLASHTTCPVCRANLVPQPDESAHALPTFNPQSDIEPQNDAVQPEPEQQQRGATVDPIPPEPEVLSLNQTMKRNRTRGSRSGRPRRFPRSHSTGHSLVQPGENTERFTLRLPTEVRNQILNRELHRATSMVVLPREGSSRRGYRTGGADGSIRGRFSRRLDRWTKSDRWVFTMAPPFLVRASSVRSLRLGGTAGEGTSGQPMPAPADAARLPV